MPRGIYDRDKDNQATGLKSQVSVTDRPYNQLEEYQMEIEKKLVVIKELEQELLQVYRILHRYQER